MTSGAAANDGQLRYVVNGKRPGRSRLVVNYSDGSAQSIHYYVTKPSQQAVSDLGTFLTTKAWYTDVTEPDLERELAWLEESVYGGSSESCIVERLTAFERVVFEFARPATQEKLKVAETVAELVCHGSRELHMKWIVVFTHSGFTARLISRYRPLVPIAAFSPVRETRRRMALVWGVRPLEIPDLRKVDQLAEISERRLLKEKLVRKGSRRRRWFPSS